MISNFRFQLLPELRQDNILRKPIAVEDFINAVKNTGVVPLGPDLFILKAKLSTLAQPTLRLRPRSLATR